MKVLEPRQAYGLLASEYDTTPNALIALEQRTLAPLLPDLRGGMVIDVGAGTGRWAEYCLDQGAHAIAVDLCHEMLRQAKVPAVQADGARLPFPDACADVVVCAFALGYSFACFGELERLTR